MDSTKKTRNVYYFPYKHLLSNDYILWVFWTWRIKILHSIISVRLLCCHYIDDKNVSVDFTTFHTDRVRLGIVMWNPPFRVQNQITTFHLQWLSTIICSTRQVLNNIKLQFGFRTMYCDMLCFKKPIYFFIRTNSSLTIQRTKIIRKYKINLWYKI